MSCPTVMSCPHSAATAAPRRSTTFAGRTGAVIRQAWRAYWEWRARKATILLLSSLDGRTLHDIGVAPGEIESLVRGGDDRCRRYDARWIWQINAR